MKEGIVQMTRSERIEVALRAKFAPNAVEVVDESAQHAGHAGASPSGETHYKVVMETRSFIGLSRVARAREVHTALEAEFLTGLHALALSLRAPEE
jgi:BolA protein